VEPGNVNGLQLSPTVQATCSNYTKAHGGAGTAYLEYFVQPGRARVLVDVLQSEHGAWFYRKRNRNMVVEVTDDVPLREGFCWLTLGQLRALHALPNLINMDARSVLSCLQYAARDSLPVTPAPGDDFAEALWRSTAVGEASGSVHTEGEILTWLNDAKTGQILDARRVPLDEVAGWHRTADRIARPDGKYFSVMAVSVHASNREVHDWTQPLFAPCDTGVIAFLVRRIDGVLHVLAHATVEPGYMDVVELGPTVKCVPANYHGLGEEYRPLFLDYVLSGRGTVRYQTVQSEEGGRFYHSESRYLVVEVDDDFPEEPPEDFRWVTVGQLIALQRHSHYVNVQARSLVSCLHACW
jgi:oxidase EvaA